MFVLKATFRGETRKLTFPALPDYATLFTNLSRVFSIPENFTLSKLLFSPEASKTGTVLIATLVRDEAQYASATAAYAANTSGMLRFTILDSDTPTTLPAGFVSETTPPTFIPFSHIPPPPIILSAQLDPHQYSPGSTSTLKPAQHHQDPQPGQPCCAVNQAKLEMHDMVEKFKGDIDRILQSPALTPAPPANIPLAPSHSSMCLFKYCTTCAKIFQGPWFACAQCSVVVCTGCHEQQAGSQFCIAAMGPHSMQKEVCAACPPQPAAATPIVVPSWPHLPPPPPVPAAVQWTPSQLWTPPQPGYAPVYPYLPSTVGDIGRGPTVANPPPPAAPVRLPIHHGIVCDGCDKVPEGSRHKCLDCQDYDLCTNCIETGGAERHNPFHEFLEIKEPGRVIVHNVYSGEGERGAVPQTTPPAPTEPVVHYATCNLCDSRIRGDRYKCATCPDWDCCSGCFNITREQHPQHAFVKLSQPSDFVRRQPPIAPMHMVTCDGCGKTVYGIRYKCMHPECPDYDLCEHCEALPIPVHPEMHPMLKMRSPSTVVPTVYRVGGTTLIPRSPEPPIPPPKPVDLMASFGQGYMHNPSRSNTMPASFFDSAPTPPRQPSPFFFKSESSRSVSPFGDMQYRARSVSPPYLPRPASPILMPGGLYEEPLVCQRPAPFTPYPYPYGRPQAVSRFSHSPSPSPSPPLFRQPQIAPSPPPVPPLRQATWAGESWETTRNSLPTDNRRYELDLAQQHREEVDKLVEAHKNLEQQVEQQQLRWSSPAVIPAAELAAGPSFWPKSSEELRHLVRSEYEPPSIAFSQLSVQEEPAVMDSPLTGEALLARSGEMSQTNKKPTAFQHSLDALLNGYESDDQIERLQESYPVVTELPAPVAVPAPIAEPAPIPATIPTPPTVPAGPRATFVDDITLPDGQIFPPGAEFMKSWRMLNSGTEDWPATTELVWVAGERLSRDPTGPASVPVGVVKVGAEVDLWTGELKAPDVPGRYGSYWRLRDGQGNLFGDNIWIEINVEESRSSDSSLSSSSIIVMPRGAQSVPTSSIPAPSISRVSTSQVEIEDLDDDSSSESDASSVSLISMPSDDDEDWASVPPTTGDETQSQRYVVLYDETSGTSGSDSE
ncbi:hypothetical protein MKEN_01279200 [Mycena kentingensis (nom. inval.)]|nr:hypothetical protein MKEN_01279200 [Mycena kentingensis (nom. inval.)]